ncbi:LysR family transcriptional regulator [Prosthecobacter sp.]|uniref:LysR family transcriptional regulator n=1 Tax=Prosthecobacter sp. TaxID=1965333 RepID=UPI00248A56B3|nr:LysR family transcriptional regulator [Prosthecobacter sp.]MDI1312176.1 LysR substrate-binding domain-containing protein [Prosthecobacter sp.]
MELYQLGYFIEIARQRSFTRAAGRLNMAQPALSQQMKNLEAELGTPLFNRGRKEMQLTAAGKAFLPRAEGLLIQAEAAKAIVSDVAQLRGGKLSIAAIPSVSACLLPQVIQRFSKQHSQVALQLIEESSERVADCVESGLADIGFLQLPASKSAFKAQPLITEPFVLLVAKTHGLARQKTVQLQQLSGESFIFYKGRARDTALEACRKAGFEPHIVCESGELGTVRALVAAGLGLAIVPRLAAGNLPASILTVAIREPKMQRQIAAVWQKGSVLSHAAATLLQLATELLSQENTAPDAF